MQLHDTGERVSYGRTFEDGRVQHVVLEVMDLYGQKVVPVAFEMLDEAIGQGGWSRDEPSVA